MPEAPDFLEGLNPPQREAVEAVDGPLLIVAGAGSGKTRVVTCRIAHLIRNAGVGPWNILAVTFTNKAAGEMRRRVIDLVGPEGGAGLQVSTFHSACARLLRAEAEAAGLSSRFMICDDADQRAVIKDCLDLMGIDKTDIPVSSVQRVIAQAKMRLEGPAEVAADAETDREKTLAELFELYERRLRENDAVDFDDLIGRVVGLLDTRPDILDKYRNRFRYILVDEYQDTNHAQYRLAEALAREHRNLCVVGDEDQSIYSWRGADIRNLLDFQERFPEAKIVRLEQNYRSTQAILSLADISISHNAERLGKNLWTDLEGGEKPRVLIAPDGKDEARMVVDRVLAHHANGMPLGDMAVFYRANSLSRPFEDELRRRNVNYRIVGGTRFYDRAEIKDLIAYLRLVENPDHSISFARVVNRPRRGIGEKSVADLQGLAARWGCSLYRAIERAAKEKALKAAALKKFLAFREMVEVWRARAARGEGLGELLEAVIKDTEFEERLGDPKDLEVIMRRENISELRGAVREFLETRPASELSDYLEAVTLQASVDELDEREDALPLMTLHCAKGLEFRIVFIIALEDGMLPNTQSVEERGNAEEERRLFYVGVTRARERLYLTRAEQRFRHGDVTWPRVSPFLLEVPPNLVEEGDAETGAAPRTTGFSQRLPSSAFGRPEERRGGRGAGGGGVSRGSVFDRKPKRAAGPRFAQGQRVRHAIFGEGVVVGCGEMIGGQPTLAVEFDDGETRSFAERYAGLKAI